MGGSGWRKIVGVLRLDAARLAQDDSKDKEGRNRAMALFAWSSKTVVLRTITHPAAINRGEDGAPGGEGGGIESVMGVWRGWPRGPILPEQIFRESG
jgi:hypothetical protein